MVGASVEQDAEPLGNGVVAQSGNGVDNELLVDDRELCDAFSCRIDVSSQALSATHPAKFAIKLLSCWFTS